MGEQQDHDHAHVGAEDSTEPQYPALEGYDSQAVSDEASEDAQGDGPPPRGLHFVHHEQGEDGVAHDVQIVIVHEHGRERLVDVSRVCLDLLHLQQPPVHFRWPFEEARVVAGLEQDVDQNEDEDVEQDYGGGHGGELHAGEHLHLQCFEKPLVVVD